MNHQMVLDLGKEAGWILMLIAGPALVTTLIIGVVVSVFQAATQINEQTLTFVPKIILLTFILAVTGPWTVRMMLEFTTKLYQRIPLLGQ